MSTVAPLVSVVVPVYNAGEFLARCLDSLVEQTYSRIEIVAVNDGSTDESGTVLRSYAECHPDCFRLVETPNNGRARARQAGVNAATGEFIGFVDADDRAHPELYERLVTSCTDEPGADVALCRYQNHTDEGGPGHIYNEGSPEMFGSTLAEHPELLNSVEASLCNKLWRRRLFDGITFPADKDFEDLATTYRLLGSARRIVRVEGPPLYFYRQGGPVSVMAAYDLRYADIADAITVNCRFFRDAGRFDALEPYLLRLALRHLIFARFGGLIDHGGVRVVWPYLDRAYETLEAEFPGWRRSAVLEEMCGSRYSLALIRHRSLMKLFAVWRSLFA